jgi:hypothetical protein
MDHSSLIPDEFEQNSPLNEVLLFVHTHKHIMMSNSNIVTQHDIYNQFEYMEYGSFFCIFPVFFPVFLHRVVKHTERNVTFGHPINMVLFFLFFPTVHLF